MRWLIAAVVALAFANPAEAGVFKARGGGAKPAAAAPAKKPAAAAPAKKPAAAPKKAAVAAKPPAKKSAAAGKARPDDLTPDEAPKTASKKKGKGDVAITEEDEDDVIIRDIDD